MRKSLLFCNLMLIGSLLLTIACKKKKLHTPNHPTSASQDHPSKSKNKKSKSGKNKSKKTAEGKKTTEEKRDQVPQDIAAMHENFIYLQKIPYTTKGTKMNFKFFWRDKIKVYLQKPGGPLQAEWSKAMDEAAPILGEDVGLQEASIKEKLTALKSITHLKEAVEGLITICSNNDYSLPVDEFKKQKEPQAKKMRRDYAKSFKERLEVLKEISNSDTTSVAA